MATPGVKATFRELMEDADLFRTLRTAFRGAAERGNCLAADRTDAQFACNEICRYIANRKQHVRGALKSCEGILAFRPDAFMSFTSN